MHGNHASTLEDTVTKVVEMEDGDVGGSGGQLQAMFEDPDMRQAVLGKRGNEAEYWLDLLQVNVRKLGEHPVGGGGFGDVWKGTLGYSETAPIVCLKVVKVYLASDVQASLKEYLREAIVWKQLKHPNLLPFLGMFYLDGTRQRICLVSPWMEHGNLVHYLKDTPRESVDHLLLVYDIVSGLSYLHVMKVVHADLKGVNILITSS
ncbi:Rho guanine nucleotide exchange factor [Marasmius crinis-equi]|uniref:Rho guanine nucleotide exchange factor n=1 Tax=Marasmius crinis-equi TaxID=585013 RepID=A0ABR3F0N8_9AGAR